MRVHDLAFRVDDLVLEVGFERVGGARGTDRVRHRLERERRLDEDGGRLVLEALSRIALAADLDLLDRRELRQRVDGLGKGGPRQRLRVQLEDAVLVERDRPAVDGRRQCGRQPELLLGGGRAAQQRVERGLRDGG